MFFLPRRQPLEVSAERVRALRPSLNTPVIATADLPAGPACAAILVHVEPGAGLQISIGVRSLASGSVVIYGFDGPVGAAVVGTALDAALSFAESMGFLFDDDMLDDDEASREKAVLRWQEMIGEGSGPAIPGEPEGVGTELFEAEGGELTDPPAPPEPPVAADSVFELGEQGPVEFEEPATEPGPSLTKFRRGAEEEDPAEAPPPVHREPDPPAPRKRALGRMRLVRRRAHAPAADAERSWLLRLLGTF